MLIFERPRMVICLLSIGVKTVLAILAPRLFPYGFSRVCLLSQSWAIIRLGRCAGSYNQVHFCFHPGGVKPALVIFAPLEMKFWVKLMN